MNKTILTLVTISIFLFLIYMVANYYTEYKRLAYKPDMVSFRFDLKSEQIDKILLSREDAKISLSRIKNRWILDNVSYLADSSKVISLISKINEIKEGRVVSRDPSQAEVYGVGPKSAIKVVFSSSGKELQTLLIGKNAENYSGSFFTLPNDNKVYAVEPLLEDYVSVDRKFWLKKDLRSIDRDNIYKIIIRGEVNYVFVKSGKKWWLKKPKIAPLSESKVRDIVDKFALLSIEDVDRSKKISECISQNPRYIVTVKYYSKKDNKNIRKKYRFYLGNSTADKKENYYASINNRNICFVVSRAYNEALKIAIFEIIDKEFIDIWSGEVSKLEFTDFIPGHLKFVKKRIKKDDYKWLSYYKGRFKFFAFDKVKKIIELLKELKIEDYDLLASKKVDFNHSFLIKTETKDIISASAFYQKDAKDCYLHSNKYPKLLMKVLCSDIVQIKDNLKNLLGVKLPEIKK
jgi:hypothetical protein